MSEDNAKTIDIKLEKAASRGDVAGVRQALAEGGDFDWNTRQVNKKKSGVKIG